MKCSQKNIDRQRLYRRKCKEELIAAYGGKCVCCGENRFEFLTLEHTEKDGAKHKKELGNTDSIHRWIRRNGYPKGRFTILCFNCNAADFYYGQCPHKSFKLSSGLEKE